MRVHLALAVVLCCAFSSPQSKVTISTLLSAYDAGDRDVVARTLKTPADFRAFMKWVSKAGFSVIGAPADPKRAIFWMDVAVAASTLSPGNDVVKVLMLGRRSARMTSSGRPEAFERLWHQTGLALLQLIKRPDLQRPYLDSLELRYVVKWDTVPASQPYGRFVLDRAVATEQACWLSQFPVNRDYRNGLTTRVIVDTPSVTGAASTMEASRLPDECRAAVSQFERASAFEDVAAEAHIRSAVGQFRLGHYDQALSALARARNDGTDPVRDYWSALMEGRTLQQLQRLPEAEAAYRGAWTLWPDARTAGTGLALILFDMNRRDEAIATAQSVYALPVSAVDPWWAYGTADTRFIRRWRDALQELAK